MTAAVTTAVTEAEPDVPARGRRWILVVLVLVLLLGAAATWFLVLAPDAGAEEDETLEDGEIVVLEPLTTTTGTSGLRHARVTMAVVLVDGVDPEVVAPRAALLQDALLREVATMDADRLRSPEGSDALRSSLSAQAREIWGSDIVQRVVLTEFLVQ